jgi:rhodanese-related sulfurtransferase/predicted transcriptional regulator
MSLKSRKLKSAMYDQLARVGRALGSGPRLEIVDLLGQSPRTVEALAGQVGQSVANTSRHLQVLRRARLVEAERDGVHVRYRLADPDVGGLFRALRRIAEARLLEIDRIARDFRAGRDGLEPVDREHLVARMRRGEVTILDVRPVEEYEAGHIPGALSLPLADLERRLAELPRDRDVVAYCRGPYCVMALDAVALLRRRGFAADPLDEGVPDWSARGLPVEASPEVPA